MARRDALIRLTRSLLARRTDLHKKLASELANLRHFKAADSVGDSADVAFETGSDEMSSRLAELDARELRQVEGALKLGTYGLCEGSSEKCQKSIPVSRSNAFPCTSLCISCQREMEKYRDWHHRSTGNWGQVFDPDALMKDQRISLSEMESELCGSR